LAVRVAQAGKAAAAASTAARVAAASSSGTLVMAAPRAGLITSWRRPSPASIQRPFT
jgi:hypothetical protein